MFGVAYADVGKIARAAGKDPSLASALWETGNHDARVLATMVCDPARLPASELDRWMRSSSDRVVREALARLAPRVPGAKACVEAWMRSDDEGLSAAGWTASGALLLGADAASEASLLTRVGEIERGIHAAPNRVRHAMNVALIAIGTRSDALAAAAIAAAKRIGKVHVDHGATGCKTPDAASYIPKARAYAAKREAKASPKRSAGPVADRTRGAKTVRRRR